jgi:hypothetical protein
VLFDASAVLTDERAVEGFRADAATCGRSCGSAGEGSAAAGCSDGAGGSSATATAAAGFTSASVAACSSRWCSSAWYALAPVTATNDNAPRYHARNLRMDKIDLL